MSEESQVISLAPKPMNSVPRAVWIGGGLLSLATAALAGALIMRSVEPAPAALTTGTATAAPDAVTGQPVPLIAAAPPAPSPRAAASPDHETAPAPTLRKAICASCGVVESVQAVKKKGEGTGLGAVAGGVIGGVVGHQAGGGRGKTALTVLGAIGGGLAGNEVEKRARSETLFDVHVRMEDGSRRVFQRAQSMAAGTHVVVEGTSLRAAREVDSRKTPGAT